MIRRRLANGLLRVLATRLLAVPLAAAAVGGCARAKAPAAAAAVVTPRPAAVTPKPPADAWINGNGFCVLPLASPALPPTGAALSASMLKAIGPTFSLPDPAAAVIVLGGRYPALDTLRVDLSNAVMSPGSGAGATVRQASTQPSAQIGNLTVRDFALVGEPIVSRRSSVNVQVTGTDVRFAVRRDRAGNGFLLMTDASAGTLHFDAATADLERIMTTMAKEQASKKGLFVRKVELNLKSVGERSVDAELYVHALVGFLPAGLKFTARVDVDDQMNARLCNLTVAGDDVLGPLVTAFLRPSLKKYEGNTKPLISFPGDIRLRDVQLRGGERVSLDAVFGR